MDFSLSHVPGDINISLLQMTSLESPESNLQVIREGLSSLSPGGILFLPENSLYFRISSKKAESAVVAFSESSPELVELRTLCKKFRVTLHMGAIPWLEDDRVYSQSVILSEEGDLNLSYRKIHLFDLELGDLKVKESDSFAPGNQLATFQWKGWKFATAICYDLRFSELFVHYVQKEKVDAFVVPAAFTAKTGEAHWYTLLRARAIESQCYIIAPAQVGEHWSSDQKSVRRTWGESLVFSPWGEVLIQEENIHQQLDSRRSGSKPITTLLSYQKMLKVRRSLPISEHRAFKIGLE